MTTHRLTPRELNCLRHLVGRYDTAHHTEEIERLLLTQAHLSGLISPKTISRLPNAGAKTIQSIVSAARHYNIIPPDHI